MHINELEFDTFSDWFYLMLYVFVSVVIQLFAAGLIFVLVAMGIDYILLSPDSNMYFYSLIPPYIWSFTWEELLSAVNEKVIWYLFPSLFRVCLIFTNMIFIVLEIEIMLIVYTCAIDYIFEYDIQKWIY